MWTVVLVGKHYQNQTKHVGLVQAGVIFIISSKVFFKNGLINELYFIGYILYIVNI